MLTMTGSAYTKLREGCNLTAKLDMGGNQCIGWGHNSPDIKPGTVWTQAQADSQFDVDYLRATASAQRVVGSGWIALDYVRKAALIDMAYQMGGDGLAKFRHMMMAIREAAWDTASASCLDSAYATQTPDRAKGAAYMLRTGIWPKGFGA